MNMTLDIYMRIFSSILKEHQHNQPRDNGESSSLLDKLSSHDRSVALQNLGELRNKMEILRRHLGHLTHDRDDVISKLNKIEVNVCCSVAAAAVTLLSKRKTMTELCLWTPKSLKTETLSSDAGRKCVQAQFSFSLWTFDPKLLQVLFCLVNAALQDSAARTFPLLFFSSYSEGFSELWSNVSQRQNDTTFYSLKQWQSLLFVTVNGIFDSNLSVQWSKSLNLAPSIDQISILDFNSNCLYSWF